MIIKGVKATRQGGDSDITNNYYGFTYLYRVQHKFNRQALIKQFTNGLLALAMLLSFFCLSGWATVATQSGHTVSTEQPICVMQPGRASVRFARLAWPLQKKVALCRAANKCLTLKLAIFQSLVRLQLAQIARTPIYKVVVHLSISYPAEGYSG